MFDTTADGSPVTKHTNKLLDVMRIDDRIPGNDASRTNGRPQWVIFHWGDLHSFKAVVSSLNLSFTYFSASAAPLRAKASLSLDAVAGRGQVAPAEPHVGHARAPPGPPAAGWARPSTGWPPATTATPPCGG